MIICINEFLPCSGKERGKYARVEVVISHYEATLNSTLARLEIEIQLNKIELSEKANTSRQLILKSLVYDYS